MYRAYLQPSIANSGTYQGTSSSGAVSEYKTVKEAQESLERIILNPSYAIYLASGYKAFIVNMETMQIVSSAERPHRPVLEWVDQR